MAAWTTARRVALAVGLSLAVHVGVAGGVLGLWLWSGRWPGHVDLSLTSVEITEIKQLPLGPPPEELGSHEEAKPRPRPRAHARSLASVSEAVGAAKAELAPPLARPAPSAPVADTEQKARKGDLSSYGPEGSRLTVLLRLDRLRETPYAGAVDQLLERLPDRNGLLAGTGLDLYRDFDALLFATPDPMNPAVTFLAARHRKTDAALRAALERGAAAGGKRIQWRTVAARPVGERRAKDSAAPVGREVDERIFVMAAPGLVVVTPPSYAQLLLTSPNRTATAAHAGAAGDGSAEPGAPEGGVPDERGAGAVAVADGVGAGRPGTPGAGSQAEERADWRELLDRIDAQDGAMPADAIAMLTAVDIFSAAPRSARAQGVRAGGAGAADDGSGPVEPPALWGLALPRVQTVVIGAAPMPFVDVRAVFGKDGEARRWQAEWPELHRKLRANAWVLLAGFAPLVDRATLEREDASLHLHITATESETRRVLQMIANLLPAPPAVPAPPLAH